MLKALEAIRSMCLKFPTQEKILIIPAFRMKGQILKYLNDSGINAVNLRVMSAGSIAMEWAEPSLIASGTKVIGYNDAADIIGEIMGRLSQEGTLEFFGNSAITPGLARTISAGVLSLKRAGIGTGAIKLDSLTHIQKKKDLGQILERYEAFLKAENYADQADVIVMALNAINSGKQECAACYVMPGVKLAWLEEQLLANLWPNNEKGQESKDFIIRAKSQSFVRAYGEYNEAKAVMRSIILNKLPLDQTLVAVTTAEPYAQLLYQLFQTYLPGEGNTNVRANLPITFGTGLPVTFTSPGKLALALLKWIKYDYKAHDLISIFASGAIKLKIQANDSNEGQEQGDGQESQKSLELEPGSSIDSIENEDDLPLGRQTIIGVIKDANLQWQRQTYAGTFAQHQRYLERKISEKEAGGESAEIYKRKQLALTWLAELLAKDIFPNIPVADEEGKIDADHLYKGIGKIIEAYKKINDVLDGDGYISILDALKGSLKSEKVSVAEAVDIMTDRIKQIKTAVENPAPGKIHIASYKTAGWTNREHVFLLGLDAGKYPGMAIEDPILLDEERLALSADWLPASSRLIEDNIEAMNRFLGAITGNLTLSYSYFDTLENRGQYPATLYSQMLEQAGLEQGLGQAGANPGQAGNDSCTLETTAEFVVPSYEEAIDENDFWVRLGITQGAQGEAGVLALMKESHPALYDLRMATDKSAQEAGRLSVNLPELIDPRCSGRIQSASSLSDYLSCRYKYLLKNVLYLKEFKEKQLDTIAWLDPLQNGSLYHEIFEAFHLKAIEDETILKDANKAATEITKLADSLIDKYEKVLPTASAYFTEKKKAEILEDCLTFAEDEALEAALAIPMMTEYRFGFDGDLALDLGEGKAIRVMGAVDRVDQYQAEDALRIVDYKTGSTYGYDILDDPAAGALNEKSLQPALYYMAMKELARRDPRLKTYSRIKEAVYYFVSRRGNYEKIKVKFSDESEEQYKEGLNSLFNQMAGGDFIQSGFGESKVLNEDFGQCKLCGYLEICRQSQFESGRNPADGEEEEAS